MNTTSRIRMIGAGAWLWAAAVSAGQHGICFEGPAESRSGLAVMKMVVGCADDSGAPCDIRPIGAVLHGQSTLSTLSPLAPDAQWRTAQLAVQAAGRFEFFEFADPRNAPVKTLLAEITFHGTGERRLCDVSPRSLTAMGATGHADGVLTGFSSDASGLVSTGSWRVRADRPTAQGRVPGDFLAVGGGAAAPADAGIASTGATQPGIVGREWTSKARTRTLAAPSWTESHVIGLRIHGLPTDPAWADFKEPRPDEPVDLRRLIRWGSAMSPGTPGGDVVPTATVGLPLGAVVLGGGARAFAAPTVNNNHTIYGQALTAVAPPAPGVLERALRCAVAITGCSPMQALSWRAESMSERDGLPGHVEVDLSHLPAKIEVGGKAFEVRAKAVLSASAPGLAPGADVGGLRGEYAVTGVGGAVHWTGPSSVMSTRLTRIEPWLDGGGAAVSTTSAGTAVDTITSAWAVGIKLVPAGSPADIEERPGKDMLIVPLVCAPDSPVIESSLCRSGEYAIPMREVCARFPDLERWGWCLPPKR